MSATIDLDKLDKAPALQKDAPSSVVATAELLARHHADRCARFLLETDAFENTSSLHLALNLAGVLLECGMLVSEARAYMREHLCADYMRNASMTSIKAVFIDFLDQPRPNNRDIKTIAQYLRLCENTVVLAVAAFCCADGWFNLWVSSGFTPTKSYKDKSDAQAATCAGATLKQLCIM